MLEPRPPRPTGRGVLGERRTVLAAALLVGAWFVAFSAFQLDHNDFMYATAAFARGDLYAEVHYPQAPIPFYFWKAVGLIAPEGYRYLTFRLVSLSLVFASIAVALVFIVRDNAARLFFLLFAAASPYLLKIGAEIGAYSLALLLLVAAMAVPVLASGSLFGPFLSGLLVGLAASTKLNLVLLALPFGLWAAHAGAGDRGERAGASGVAALAAGVLVGLAPSLIELARAPAAFLLHTVTFHSELTSAQRGLTPLESVKDIARDLLDFGYLYAPAAFLAIYSLARPSHQRPARAQRLVGVLLLASLATALVSAALPLIVFTQYLAPASAFCALAFAHVFAYENRRFRTLAAWCVVPLLALSLAESVGVFAGRAIAQGARPDLLRVVDVNLELRRLRGRLDRRRPDCSDEIFTLAGAFVVDSGFTAARYMEAGVFWYRLKDVVPERYLADARYNLDPYLLDPVSWIRRASIDFLLVGYYGAPQEAELRAHARARAFASRTVGRIDGKDITLLYDPACLTRPPAAG